jgi:alpha-ketoglutaric semialdehyde dehydrogenase
VSMELDRERSWRGCQLIGLRQSHHGSEIYTGVNPKTRGALAGRYVDASQAEFDAACEVAGSSFTSYSRLSPAKRAEFLRPFVDGSTQSRSS